MCTAIELKVCSSDYYSFNGSKVPSKNVNKNVCKGSRRGKWLEIKLEHQLPANSGA